MLNTSGKCKQCAGEMKWFNLVTLDPKSEEYKNSGKEIWQIVLKES